MCLLIISSMAVIPSFDTDLLAQTPQPSANEQVFQPLDVADSIYTTYINTSKFLEIKNITLTPRMTVTQMTDQGFLKGVGNITDNQTFVDTHLSDKLTRGRGNGTFETPDGQSIAWTSSGIGRSVDGRWIYYDLLLFNNTQSKSLSILNNSIGFVISIGGNGTDHMWLLEAFF